jgi:hypothetical protein
MGRSTKYAHSRKKKNANDVRTARISSARMSKTRRMRACTRESGVIPSEAK